jgi:hypothetical protein
MIKEICDLPEKERIKQRNKLWCEIVESAPANLKRRVVRRLANKYYVSERTVYSAIKKF